MARVDVSKYQTFSEITGRLDDIVMAVRDKDVSLERSLDLFDEAIALGSKAVDMVDATDFSPEEEAKLEQEKAEEAKAGVGETGAEKDETAEDEQDAAAEAGDAADASDASGATSAE